MLNPAAQIASTAPTAPTAPSCGDADISSVAALFANEGRARMLAALADGRALPGSVLADEAGIAASTASEHLTRLVAAGLLSAERSGRHRYYRLADERVAAVVESLSLLAPQRPVRSLRESTRAGALRRARTCYDHLAGRLGVAVTEALVDCGALRRTDGVTGTDRGHGDKLSSPVAVHPYRLGPASDGVFAALGVDVQQVSTSTRRPLLRFCVDWTEQRHHLAGALGAAVLGAFEDADWIRRGRAPRVVVLTPSGQHALTRVLGLPDQGAKTVA